MLIAIGGRRQRSRFVFVMVGGGGGGGVWVLIHLWLEVIVRGGMLLISP